jgi:hypothetical protein
LRRVLSKKGLQHLIAENLENCLSVQVQSYLKKVKTQAKNSFDQVCAQPTLQIEAIHLLSNNPNSLLHKRQQMDSYPDSKEFINWLQSHMDANKAETIRQQFTDFNNFLLSVKEKRKIKPISFKDPCEIPRNKMMETLSKMRANLFDKLKVADDDDLHSVPIQDMGNYHEYLKNQAPPLRELENALVRQHMFGNPFKLVSKDQKASMFGADEIDEVFEESTENSNQFQQQKSQQQQQQQQQQMQQLSPGGGTKRSFAGSKRRSGVKGPLSRRVNYLKNLYTQNTNSSSASTISDSDAELDDTLSTVSSQFNMSEAGASTAECLLDQTSSSQNNNDVANLNDFYDSNVPMIDIEIQSFETNATATTSTAINEDVSKLSDDAPLMSILSLPQTTTLAQQQQLLRPVSAISNISSVSSFTNDADLNLFSNSALCDNYLEQCYIQLKILCIEQIKKPGKDHSGLFKLINDSQLTLRMRQFLIKELVYESTRFKRFGLIQYLMKFSSLLNQIPIAATTSATNGSSNSNVKSENAEK